MCKKSSVIVSRFLVVALLMAMLVALVLPVAALGAENGAASVSVSTTPGSTENYRYFKEDTSYDMTNKVDAVTFEFELVYDDTEGGSTDNTIVFDIRHKGEKVNKQPSDSGSYSYQWASFEFSDELLEKYGNKSAYELLVVFRYKWWNNAGEVVDNVAQLSTSPYSDTTF